MGGYTNSALVITILFLLILILSSGNYYGNWFEGSGGYVEIEDELDVEWHKGEARQQPWRSGSPSRRV